MNCVNKKGETMSSFPIYKARKTHDINGIWDFAFLGDVDPDNIKLDGIAYDDLLPVPSAFDTFPAYAGKRGAAVYRTFVELSPGSTGRLHFHGLGIWAAIYVDGEKLYECQLPYSGFDVEVPASDKGRREIAVVIDNRFDAQRSPLQEQAYDFFAYGGIFRSVELHEVPACSIDRVYVDTVDPAKGIVDVKILLKGETPDKISLGVSFDDDNEVRFDDLDAHDGMMKLKNVKISNFKPWTPEAPDLHTITVRTDDDSVTERFGVRQIKVDGTKILLNGKPVKLLGFCRHEAHPQFGPALPYAQLVQDLQLMKDMGCNFVRGSHYPQDQRFLDLCDEMGFMVFEESLGWQNRPEQFTNKDFCSLQVEQTRLMVRNSYNHPSVIMWGYLNEGHSDTEESRVLYKLLADSIREEDSTRPVTFATCRLYKDVNLDCADIISCNTYPGWYAHDNEELRPLDEISKEMDRVVEFLDEAGLGDKPLIISEIGAGAIYGWRDPLNAHWSEEYQRDFMDIICNLIVDSERINGVSLWQFCDCRTYSSSRALFRPRAFNNKGIVDEYRRPKLAYQSVKKAFTK
jgi:beta-glucuronidase